MDAGVGGKIIKLTIESGFSRGVLANCIYESEREWRGGLFEGGGGCSWAIVAKGGPLYGGEVICAFLSLGAYWRKYGICNMNLKLMRFFSCT